MSKVIFWENRLYQKDPYLVKFVKGMEEGKLLLDSESHLFIDKEYYLDYEMTGILNGLSEIMQPPTNPDLDCEAILISPLHHFPIHFKVACNTKLENILLLCTKYEKRDASHGAKYPPFHIQNKEGKIIAPVEKCKGNWFGLRMHVIDISRKITSLEYRKDSSSIIKSTVLRCISLVKSKYIQDADDVEKNCHDQDSQVFGCTWYTQCDGLDILIDVFPNFTANIENAVFYPERNNLGHYIYDNIGKLWNKESISLPNRTIIYTLCHKQPDLLETSTDCLPGHLPCLDGTCISDHYQCNGINDCSDGKDEKSCPPMCFRNSQPMYDTDNCTLSDFSPPHCQCGFLYLQIDHEDCSKALSNEFEKSRGAKNFTFECHNGRIIPAGKVNDLIPDCEDAEDEPEYSLILSTSLDTKSRKSSSKCENQSDVSCVSGHSQCFPQSKVCVVDFDADGHLLYCRNGAHLANCEHYVCIGFFKCPGLYCLPVHRLCDQVRDCPGGEDELQCVLPLSCPGMLRCSTGNCVQQEYICDTVPNCPNNEDELFCDIGPCPDECLCIGSSFNCSFTQHSELPSGSPGLQIYIGDSNTVAVTYSHFSIFSKLVKISLKNNGINKLPHGKESAFKVQKYVRELNLESNNIPYLGAYTFQGLDRLENLVLKQNPILFLSDFALAGLANLKVLNIINTGLHTISPLAFHSLESIESINLSCNSLTQWDASFFNELDSLKVLDITHNAIERSSIAGNLFKSLVYFGADDWTICCTVPNARLCGSEASSVSSCDSLIGSRSMRSAVWSLGIVILINNCFVLFFRSIKLKQSNPVNLVTLSLASSDTLMGIYFLGLAIADFHFMGKYYIHRDTWTMGLACNMFRFIALFSFQMSFSTVTLLFCVYANVVQVHRNQMLLIYYKVIAACIFNHLIMFSICLTFDFLFHKSADDYCLIFQVSSKSGSHGPLFFIFLNNLMMVIQVLMCMKLVKIVKSSTDSVVGHGNLSGQDRHRKMIKSLLLLILPGLLHWMCFEIILLLQMYLDHTSARPPGWLTLVLLPWSSVSNPFMHTIRNLVAKKKM